MIHRSLAALGLLAISATTTAQSFTFTDFSSVSSLTLLGNAAQSGTALRLTANSSNQTGWAWRQGAVPVVAGFDTTFSFRITPPTVGTKAEGMALVIHDDPNGLATTGGTVWGMGYGTGANTATGIRNSIAIELDTFQDGFLSDTSANELTIHTRGPLGNHENEQYSIARNTPATNLSNGLIHSLRVRYVPGTIEVFVDGATTPAISRAYSLTTGGQYVSGAAVAPPVLATGTAIVGFCATTGAGTLTELVEILSWTWTSTSLKDPCYAGSLGEDVLFVENSTGGFLRKVELATYQPFTITMQPPSTFGPNAPYILLMSLAPNPAAIGTNLGFGSLCMPILPLGPLDFVFADNFGIFPPLFPSAPAPFAFPLPAGVITFPFEFTLQAVVATGTGPGLGVSNAVDVKFAPALPPLVTTVTPISATPGTSVTVTGSRFLPGVGVTVNGTPAPITSASSTQIVCSYPAGVACGALLTVTNPDGQNASVPFNPVPTVLQTVFPTGPAAGNATFLVVGSGFSPGTTVTIGGAPAIIQTITASSINMKTPAGAVGPATVVITTPGGCTVNTTYTYL